MFSKAKVRRCFSSISRFKLALILTLCLTVTAVALLIPKSNAASPPAFGPTLLHLHGNPTDDNGYTGVGAADVVNTGGPFIAARDTLGTGPAAHWDVPVPAVNGSADQNPYDPNWIW